MGIFGPIYCCEKEDDSKEKVYVLHSVVFGLLGVYKSKELAEEHAITTFDLALEKYYVTKYELVGK